MKNQPAFDIPIVESERIILRKITSDDAPDLFAFTSKKEVTEFLSYHHNNLSDTQKYILEKNKNNDLGQSLIWGVEYKETNKYIGTCGFSSISKSNRSAEIAFSLSDAYWGKGFAQEMVKALFEYGFGSMNLNRIEAKCVTGNIRSQRVMERSKMEFEGILRENLFLKEQFRDVKLYSMLKKDYIIKDDIKIKIQS